MGRSAESILVSPPIASGWCAELKLRYERVGERTVLAGVIHVAAGDKIPRKGRPGITRSDLLVINKIDLAPLVGASLEVMDRDARRMRGARPFVFTNLKTGLGPDTIVRFVEERGMVRAKSVAGGSL